MLICIDAGHGKYTPGKRCLKSIDPAETREWWLNARVADKLQHLLAGYDCETMRVDDVTGERDVSLQERVRAANKAKATVYLSIHHNAGIKGGDGGGVVVFTAPGCQKQSKVVQEAVYRHLILQTGLRGNRANPTTDKTLYVLRHTTMEAVLAECGFMDSTHDTPIILTDDFAGKAAQGFCDALVEVYKLRRVDAPAPVIKPGQPSRSCYDDWVIPASRFCVEFVDEGKLDCGPADYCTGGYTSHYKEGKARYTMPAGHCVADCMDISPLARKLMEDKFRGNCIYNGKAIRDAAVNPYDNPFCGHKVSTLIVADGKAGIRECLHVPAADYAVSGLPIVRDGAAITKRQVLDQGFDLSPLRPTWHMVVGLRPGEDVIHVMSMETHTGDTLGELYGLLRREGFTDAIKLDGGHPFVLHHAGKDLAPYSTNDRLSTIIRELPEPEAKPEPAPAEKAPEGYDAWLANLRWHQKHGGAV